ncbi:hypothetical protein FAF44_18975 [Nonomuraea sp. MG754425]|uniref:hypothetical protein n=1 Tax=Nonomuraea sp. MG754425 TaxID=2570319 RepID=UPI001F276307|nr:hypothetical protein [Nonomuraea sp. MG754425]MCF6470462.1 hypothetical protein [Nonomuraea sp. MG754425]
MGGTIAVEGSALRRVAYMGMALLAGVLVLVAAVTMAPTEDERFTNSVGGMEAAARSLGEGDELERQTIGNLTFEKVFRANGLVYFQQGQGWLGDRAYGYVWSPHVQPRDVEHVEGPWYMYTDLED